MDKTGNKINILIAFACVYIIWGSTYLAIRFAVETIPPFFMAGARFITAGLIMYGWTRYKSGTKPTLQHWISTTIIGAFLLLGGNGCVVWAEQFVPSGITALIVSTVPLWMVAFNWVTPDKVKPDLKTALGIFIGLVGIALLVGLEPLESDKRFLWGIIALISGAGLWSAGSIYAKYAKLPESMMMTTGMEMLMGGILLTIFGFIFGEHTTLNVSAISMKSVYSLIYLIVFGALIAFSAYIYLLHNVSPAKVSTYAYVNPVIAVFLGWLLGNETFTLMTIAAAGIIIFAVFLITSSKK